MLRFGNTLNEEVCRDTATLSMCISSQVSVVSRIRIIYILQIISIFPFRKLQSFISFHFVSFRFVSQITVSRVKILKIPREAAVLRIVMAKMNLI